MTFTLPSEIVVERFLPTFRVLLASELADRGATQQEIADYIGVTQPAVSKYVSGDAPTEDVFAEHPRTVETAERVAEGLVEGEMTQPDALAEVLALVRTLEDRGPICEVHEEEMPSLQGLGCDLCVRGTETDLLAENEVLHDVRKAARLFESAEGVVDHIPNVGTNIGYALPEPDDVTDVAAIPGRIYVMRGRVHVPSNPEFGASENVAGLILAAASVEPDLRAAVNLRTSDELLDAARDAGFETFEFDPSYEGRRHRLGTAFGESGVPEVAYHEGDYGVEPITYVLGSSATDTVERVAELVG
ncbi:MAG: thiamine-phosphate synthase family protein [Halobacteria archaeon]|nr:thiamine-phosphate synthase family protein [Halobacteria archaeon]